MRLVSLEPDRRIVGEADFVSDDPAYAGTMRMTWTFEPSEDHQVGLTSSLANLARFTEAR